MHIGTLKKVFVAKRMQDSILMLPTIHAQE